MVIGEALYSDTGMTVWLNKIVRQDIKAVS